MSLLFALSQTYKLPNAGTVLDPDTVGLAGCPEARDVDDLPGLGVAPLALLLRVGGAEPHPDTARGPQPLSGLYHRDGPVLRGLKAGINVKPASEPTAQLPAMVPVSIRRHDHENSLKRTLS